MKDRRRGGGILFSLGCLSQPAVSVDDDPVEKEEEQQQVDDASSSTTTAKGAGGGGEEEKCAGGGGEEEKAVAAAARGTIVQRLIKSVANMFAAAYDGGGKEEGEREIVIGYPTDVVHVGHIGWNDLAGGMGMGMGMVSAFSLPSSLSLRQLEIAMEAASHP